MKHALRLTNIWMMQFWHISRVTIIHGKGTGALRKGIWQYLKKHPLVQSYRSGEFGEGEYGVTIVEL